MRLVLPPGALADRVDANRQLLLLFHTGPEVYPGFFADNQVSFRDATHVLRALDRYGYRDEAAEVLRSVPGRQHRDGHSDAGELVAIAEHWRMTRDPDLLGALGGLVERRVRSIDRARQSRRRRPSEDSYRDSYRDAFWGLRGLLDGAALLGAAGRADEAARASASAKGMAADLDRSLAVVAKRLGSCAIPAGRQRRLDAAAIDSLAACQPLGLLAATSPAVSATAELIRSRFSVDEAFFDRINHTGLGPLQTLQLALVEIEAGDRRALDRLDWLVRVASPTSCWPEAVHPQLGGGCMGSGHDGRATADFLGTVRNLLVREAGSSAANFSAAVAESPSAELVLCSLLPTSWRGQGLEVHDAPTAYGKLSFALRWHGDRPALLWELRPWEANGPIRLRAPGLDPRWSSVEPNGEALLAPVPAESFA
jgi:hypothetical protein